MYALKESTPLDKSQPAVIITESYKDYIPPINAAAVIRELLRYVPPKCLIGLERIVLTNTFDLPRRRRRSKTWARKRKVKVVEACGLYHSKSDDQPAWIEILVDNLWQYEIRVCRMIPFLKHVVLADVLYHELGHHIHHTLRPEHQERENVADEWSARLGAHFVRKKYWYLRPLLHLISRIANTRWFRRTFPKPF